MILVQFPDESVKLDEVEERRVLTALEVVCMRAARSTARPPISPRVTSRAWWLASTGVRRISSKRTSAQSASIFAAGAQVFRYAGLTSKTQQQQFVEQSRCSFASANCFASAN